MASITVSVAATQGTVTVTKNISNADLVRLIAAMGEFHESNFHGSRGEDPPPPKTDANILRAWVNYWLQSTQRQVKDYEARAQATADVVMTDA